MMMKHIELDNIGFDVGFDLVKQGVIELRFRKMIYDNGVVIWSAPHRMTIDVPPEGVSDSDYIDELMAMLNADPNVKDFGGLPEGDRVFIEDATKRVWTQEVRDAVYSHRSIRAIELQKLYENDTSVH